MKKTYITPNIIVRNITPHTLLADSITPKSGDGNKVDDSSGGWAKQGTGFDWGDSWSNNDE